MPSGQLPRTLQPPPELPDDPTLSTVLAQYLRTFSLWCRHGFADKLSGTTAQPGLMLQAFNPPAGVQPTVWMVEVGQNGNLHTQQISLASGDLGTPIRAGTAGVTDGSNATPGQIGEFLQNSASVTPAGSVYTNVTSITLTPGDWDVSGSVYNYLSTGLTTNVQAGFNTVSGATTQDVVYAGGDGVTYWRVAIPTRRYNVTVNTIVYLIAFIQFSTGVGTSNGTIQARRMR